MQLVDFLQFVSDLDQNTKFYFKINQKNMPLSKIALTSKACFLLTGNNPITQHKLIKLLNNIHPKNLPILYRADKRLLTFYGMQISLENHTATLM